MAYPTDILATGELVTAAQINRWPVMLADELLSADDADFDFTSIPAHWTHLRLVVYVRGTQSAVISDLLLRFNGDTAGNYDSQRFNANGAAMNPGESLAAAFIQLGAVPAATATANSFGEWVIDIAHYAGASNHKVVTAQGSAKYGTTTGTLQRAGAAGFWRSTAAANRLTLLLSGGNLAAGSRATLFGMGRI